MFYARIFAAYASIKYNERVPMRGTFLKVSNEYYCVNSS